MTMCCVEPDEPSNERCQECGVLRKGLYVHKQGCETGYRSIGATLSRSMGQYMTLSAGVMPPTRPAPAAGPLPNQLGTICHVPGDTCLGCDHYYGRSDKCEYAPAGPDAHCDECDPSFGCFATGSPCSKRPPDAQTPRKGRAAIFEKAFTLERENADLRRQLAEAQEQEKVAWRSRDLWQAEAERAQVCFRDAEHQLAAERAELKRLNPLYTAACIGQRDAETALAAERKLLAAKDEELRKMTIAADGWAATAKALKQKLARNPMTDGRKEGEVLARRFHEIYERLAPRFGYETRKETRAFDPSTPNGKLMIAVCEELRAELAQCGEAVAKVISYHASKVEWLGQHALKAHQKTSDVHYMPQGTLLYMAERDRLAQCPIVTEEQVAAAAKVIADSPLIDAPKLPAECWYGLARSILATVAIPPAGHARLEPVTWRYKFRDRAALDAFLASEKQCPVVSEKEKP